MCGRVGGAGEEGRVVQCHNCSRTWDAPVLCRRVRAEGMVVRWLVRVRAGRVWSAFGLIMK